MKIDLFTLVAQIVNFLVLLWLLKRFLYRPIVRTMDERERQIGRSLQEAEEREAEARREAAVCHAERQEIEDRRGEMLAQAEADAEAWRRERIRQARADIEERHRRWREAVEREKESFLRDLRQRAGAQVYRIARRALADLATVELERHIIATFIARLPALEMPASEATPAPVPETITAAELQAEAARPEAVICTAFPLDEAARAQIGEAVRERLGGEYGLRFEESSDLICGIELRAGGQAAAWSLREYLETLEEQMSQAFSTRTEG